MNCVSLRSEFSGVGPCSSFDGTVASMLLRCHDDFRIILVHWDVHSLVLEDMCGVHGQGILYRTHHHVRSVGLLLVLAFDVGL